MEEAIPFAIMEAIFDRLEYELKYPGRAVQYSLDLYLDPQDMALLAEARELLHHGDTV